MSPLLIGMTGLFGTRQLVRRVPTQKLSFRTSGPEAYACLRTKTTSEANHDGRGETLAARRARGSRLRSEARASSVRLGSPRGGDRRGGIAGLPVARSRASRATIGNPTRGSPPCRTRRTPRMRSPLDRWATTQRPHASPAP